MTIKAQTEKIWTKDFTLLTLAAIAVSIAYQIPATMQAVFIKNLGGSATIAGSIMLAWSITACIVRPIVGALSDSIGYKKLVYWGGFFFALAMLGCTFTRSIEVFSVLRVVQAAAHAAIYTAIFAGISEILPKSRVGEATTYFVGFSQDAAVAFGAPIGLALIFGDDFTWLWLGTTAIICLNFAFAFFVDHKGNAHIIKEKATEQPVASQYTGIWKVIEKTAIMPTVIMFFAAIGGLATMFFLALFGKINGIYGVSIGSFFTAAAATQFATRFFSGRLADKIGILPVIVTGLLSNIVAFIWFALVGVNINFLAVGIIYGLGQGVIRAMLNAYALKVSPPGRIGVTTGTFSLGNGVGLGLCAFIWGVVIDKAGFTALFWGSAAIMTLVIVMCLIFLREKSSKSNKAISA